MDEQLIRTFLAVVAAESFVAAAERIHVTQSAISQRIQKLETILGQRLFQRSKGGIELTSSGVKFEQYARSLIQLWDEAIYQTALPAGFTGNLSLGCEESLWPELSANWLAKLEDKLPKTAISFQTGEPNNLSNLLLRGRLDIAVLYMPIMRPGFQVERILDDKLVLVTAIEDHDGELGDDYVYATWGPEFAMAHSRWYPSLKPPKTVLQVGPAIAQYLIDNQKTAFLPYRVADDFVEAGKLYFVKDSPVFPYPSYAVWTEKKPAKVIRDAISELRIAAKNAPWIELGV